MALNRVGPLADDRLAARPAGHASSYLLAAVAACCLHPRADAARAARRAARSRVTVGRPTLAGLAQRRRLDLVLVALALLGYWQLRRYHGVLVSHKGGLGIDPFLVAAPAVLLLAGALLSLRLCRSSPRSSSG